MTTVRIGNVEIEPLTDSRLLADLDVFMPKHADAFRSEYSHLFDERGLMAMAVTCFLVRSEGRTMLVDTGIGGRRRPNFPVGHLDEALAGAGVRPEEIDVVLNTHLHIDHVGWNTVEDEAGNSRVFFPNATFWVQQTEWDYWMDSGRAREEGNEHLLQCVEPLRDQANLKLVGAEEAITQDLTFIPAPGHTPGHVAIGIYSAGEKGIIIGDASHHPVQLDHPDWSPSFDIDPDRAALTRDAIFDRAADEGPTWLAGHWEQGIGRIVRLEGRRVFQAL